MGVRSEPSRVLRRGSRNLQRSPPREVGSVYRDAAFAIVSVRILWRADLCSRAPVKIEIDGSPERISHHFPVPGGQEESRNGREGAAG